MVKNGTNLYGCVSTNYLSSSNSVHYGIFVRQRAGSILGFYYFTEDVGNKVFRCLGIYYDFVGDKLITYVKALT